MNPFILAVVLIRVAGAWTVVSVFPYLLSTLAGLASGESTASFRSSFVIGALEMLVYPVAGLGGGVFFLLKATWVARVVTRGLHPEGHCQRCGYNIASAGATTCPECGHAEAKAS